MFMRDACMCVQLSACSFFVRDHHNQPSSLNYRFHLHQLSHQKRWQGAIRFLRNDCAVTRVTFSTQLGLSPPLYFLGGGVRPMSYAGGVCWLLCCRYWWCVTCRVGLCRVVCAGGQPCAVLSVPVVSVCRCVCANGVCMWCVGLPCRERERERESVRASSVTRV